MGRSFICKERGRCGYIEHPPLWASGKRRNIAIETGRFRYDWRVLTGEDKQWLGNRLEKVGANLLTEFHKWASPVELRSRSHAAAIRALDAEVESLSARLKNLEGR